MARESSYSDEQVVQRVRAGERDQFGVLVDRHLRAVYAVAYAVLRDPADAEDVTQETFLKAYRAFVEGSAQGPGMARRHRAKHLLQNALGKETGSAGPPERIHYCSRGISRHGRR